MFGNLVLASDLADLQGVWTSIVQKWIGPAVFIILGCMSLKFLFSREWTKFISFLALGAIVAVVIYVAPALFSQTGSITQSAGEVAKQIS